MDEKQNIRVLLIEDEPIIGIMFEEILIDAGFEVVGIAARLKFALDMIENCQFDAAIVDANLAGESASPAASALASRGVPFFMLSSYSAEQIRDAFPGVLLVRKPCLAADLIQSVRNILTSFSQKALPTQNNDPPLDANSSD